MSGKTAVITGASSGIGRSTAVALSQAGWNVVLAARRADALADTVKLCANPDACLALAGDVTDDIFVGDLFARSVEKFGTSMYCRHGTIH